MKDHLYSAVGLLHADVDLRLSRIITILYGGECPRGGKGPPTPEEAEARRAWAARMTGRRIAWQHTNQILQKLKEIRTLIEEVDNELGDWRKTGSLATVWKTVELEDYSSCEPEVIALKILPRVQAAAEAHYDLICPLYKPGDRIVYTVNGGGERIGTIVFIDGDTISTMDDGIKMTVSVQKRDIKRLGPPQ